MNALLVEPESHKLSPEAATRLVENVALVDEVILGK